MGQSGSKSQRPPAQNAEASTSAAPATEFGALEQHDRSSSSTTNSESRSRRPSLRKRVVSLIKPSSGRAREVSEASTSGLAGSPAAETVKHKASWRKSRRWSKSPVDFKPSQPTLVEDAERPSSPHSSSLRQQSIPSMQSSDKGKKRADDIEDDQEEPSVGDVTPQVYTPSERTLTPYPSMTEILPPPRRRGSTARHPDPPRVAEGSGSQHPSSSLPDPTPEAVPTTSNSTTPASPSTSPSLPTRQFPPPGTLVVVQGIVHTTDVSRGPSPNNLPSGLDANSNVNMDSNTTRGSLPVPPLRRQSSAPAISGRSSTETNAPSSTQSPDPVAPTSTSHSAISPGSIDVLGTLLSVAAAATAASLLTGSSDPILTSSPVPTSSSPSSDANSASSTPTGSLSPTTTASSTTAPPPYSTDMTYAASRAERMRQAWSTIRERLGLRPNPPLARPSTTSDPLSPNDTTTSSTTNGREAGGTQEPTPQQRITDTRELMLAEMARAFNIGLGLNGMGGTHQGDGAYESNLNVAEDAAQAGEGSGALGLEGEATAGDIVLEEESGERAEGVLPPEGSFDRFLVDLQADLRVALTGEGAEVAMGALEEPQVVDNVQGDEVVQSVAGQSEVSEEAAGLGSGSVESEAEILEASPALDVAAPPAPLTTPPPLPPNPPSEPELLEVGSSGVTSAAADSIPIEASSSPEVVTEVSSAASGESDAQSTDVEPSAAPSASPSTNTMGSGRDERMDANGRINWWRLYRFPAINSPRTSTSPSTTTSADPAPAPEAVAEPAPNAAPPASSSPASSANTGEVHPDVAATPFLPNFLPPPSGQTVVPVIVVGLQSVNPGQFPFEHPHAHPHTRAQHNRHQQRDRHLSAHQSDHQVDANPTAERNHGPEDLRTQLIRETLERMEQPERMRDMPLRDEMAAAIAAARRERAWESPVWVEDNDDEDEDESAEVETIRTGGGRGQDVGGVSSTAARVEDASDDDGPPPLIALASSDEEDDEDDDDDDVNDDFDYSSEDEVPSAPTPEMYLGLGARRTDRNARARALAQAEEEEERRQRRMRRIAERLASRARREAEAEAARARRAAAALAAAAEGAERRRASAGAARGPSAGVAEGTTAPGGARTFLIYVIGGYYPPDHSIVTGGPESFESFEALLELAEMLGHAKPPTATKEEIERSGLETIKPAQLEKYEESGKIASSCAERCLICLDNYDTEDVIRVMKCRHAFHQGCVDKWMQTGRNNCPACRSTGVGPESASSTTAPANVARGRIDPNGPIAQRLD